MLMSTPTPATVLRQSIQEHLTVIQQLLSQQEVIFAIARKMLAALAGGGKVLWCGNRGCAADSQHLAAELVGRFQRERQGLASIALTTDTSILTAIANDYGYEAVFRRQVEALCRPDDVLVGISTSGNSANVCQAMRKARQIGAFTVALTGAGGGRLRECADATVMIDSRSTSRIQEAHILVGHMLCDYIESELVSQSPGSRTEDA